MILQNPMCALYYQSFTKDTKSLKIQITISTVLVISGKKHKNEVASNFMCKFGKFNGSKMKSLDSMNFECDSITFYC